MLISEKRKLQTGCFIIPLEPWRRERDSGRLLKEKSEMSFGRLEWLESKKRINVTNQCVVILV